MADHTQSNDPHVGRLINDRFRILQRVARGAASRIYRAEQVPQGRTVALKVLDASYGQKDARFAKRFFLEASLASQLRHPNTVAVFDYGRTEDGTYFVAMEYVDGVSLRSVLRRAGRLAPERAVAIAIQIARSLCEAHRLGVIHRDLRPANVLMTQHGDEPDFVKVLDFGLAKPAQEAGEAAQTEVFLGSPKYVTPEQIRGETPDARADIYALGVVTFEMLSGEVPFAHETSVKTLMAHLHQAAPPILDATVPPSLGQLVDLCLRKDRTERPASMDEVVERLQGIQAQLAAAPAASGADASATARSSPSKRAARVPRFGSLGQALSRPRSTVPLDDTGGRRILRLAVIVGGVAAAGAVALWQTSDGVPSDGGNAASHPAVIERVQTAQPPAALRAGTITVQVSSEPPGANVGIDGVDHGPTPVLVELDATEAPLGSEIELTISRPGYETVRVVRALRSRRLEVHAALAPAGP